MAERAARHATNTPEALSPRPALRYARRQPPGSGVRPCPKTRYRPYDARHLDELGKRFGLSPQQRFDMRVVAAVLPFRTNHYVVEQLIDWSRVPDDPLFQLSFPQRGMLPAAQFARMGALLAAGTPAEQVRTLATRIRAELNPHPAGQLTRNVPRFEGRPLGGMQHKYRETVLLFPAAGQTCHAFCSFCFRWAQVAGETRHHLPLEQMGTAVRYLAAQPATTDVLITGGDPLVMRTSVLRRFVEPLLDPALAHIQNIRLGTKTLSFWPHRYVSDADADELLRLLEELISAGKHVSLMAHVDHWRELDTPICEHAVERIRSTGTVIRAQGPLLRHINDDAAAWAESWRRQVRLGIVPYYMFVARNTGAHRYFEVPLVRAHRIYRGALTRVSGLARTARGPSMSAAPGKVEVQGIAEVAGERVLVLRFVQAREPDWVQRPFFARYDEQACWLDQLRPAFGEERFFFEADTTPI